MNRFLPLALVWLLGLNTAFAAAISQPPIKPLRPAKDGHRFLFVVQNSSSMRRLEHEGRQTLFDMIYKGLDGKMYPGDTFGLWTFATELNAGAFPLQVWDPHLLIDLSSKAAIYVKEQPTGRKVKTKALLTGIENIIMVARDVNIVILSDEHLEWQGTLFDDAMNKVYEKRTKELLSKKKPFVTTIVARDGKWVSARVTLGDEEIYLPPRPDPPPPVPSGSSAGLTNGIPSTLGGSSATATNAPKKMLLSSGGSPWGSVLPTNLPPNAIIITNENPLPPVERNPDGSSRPSIVSISTQSWTVGGGKIQPALDSPLAGTSPLQPGLADPAAPTNTVAPASLTSTNELPIPVATTPAIVPSLPPLDPTNRISATAAPPPASPETLNPDNTNPAVPAEATTVARRQPVPDPTSTKRPITNPAAKVSNLVETVIDPSVDEKLAPTQAPATHPSPRMPGRVSPLGNLTGHQPETVRAREPNGSEPMAGPGGEAAQAPAVAPPPASVGETFFWWTGGFASLTATLLMVLLFFRLRRRGPQHSVITQSMSRQ